MSSGTPYIGSKISLISKAKIRYEGFLYTIDQQESTVTLAKVRSLGTEDRVPSDPVPAREEIFEYIVFRGHDIEDLHVCEAPNPPVEDPAIVHNGPIQSTQNFPNRNAFQPPAYAPFGGGMPNFGYSFPQTTGPDQHSNRQPTPPNLPRTPTPTDNFKQPAKDDRSQNQSRNNKNNERNENNPNRKDDRRGFYDNNRYKDRRDNNRDNRTSRRDSNDRKDYKDNRDSKEGREKRDNRNNYRESRESNSGYKKDDKDKNYDRNAQNERRRGAPRGRGNRGKNSRGGSNNREKFTEDFDFETSNAKFHKEEIEKELLKVLNKTKISDEEEIPVKTAEEVDEKDHDDSDPLPSPDKFYDRSKSFFDNISCEAMGPKAKPVVQNEEPVMTRRQERALNVETFGTTGGYYRRGGGYRGGRGYGWRGRGRGGRGRGRGGWRGRGGGGSRGGSSQNWVDYEFDYEAAGIKSQSAKSSAGS